MIYLLAAPHIVFYIVCLSQLRLSVDMSSSTYQWLVTPEKLCTPEFLRLLDVVYRKKELNRLVVDEVKDFATMLPSLR